MRPQPGDRIKVVGAMDDPDPIPVGTTGTVMSVSGVGTQFEQAIVNWDRSPDGRKRTLMLVPEDYEAIGEA